MAAIEQQRERRVGLHLPVRVSGRDAAGATFAESCRTLNISGGGVAFESRHNLAIGGRLALYIELPEGLRKHFGGKPVYRASAVICRLERFEGSELSRVGARFLGELEA